MGKDENYKKKEKGYIMIIEEKREERRKIYSVA